MEKINIEATTNAPKVILDHERMIYEISGESRPKDPPRFFQPILQWLDELRKMLKEQKDPSNTFDFNFKFEYFNSLSAKYILDICKRLGRFRSEGNNVNIRWHYEEDDDDMHEVGQEMSRISKIDFEFVEIKPS
jgi:hypothetical protein